MNYEENTLLLAEFMNDPTWVAWKKQKMDGSFPYYILQYHNKWSILKPVIERVDEVAGVNRFALPVRKLLSRSIADRIELVYVDTVEAIKFLTTKPLVDSNA
jgi:hypothetical protein